MKRYKVDCYSDHIEESVDGEWVRYEDHVEAMKRIAGDSAQQVIPVAEVAAGNLGSRLMWHTEDAHSLTPVGTLLYAAPAPSASPRYTQADMERFGKAVADAREARIAGDTQGEAEKIAHALSSADWSGVSIGNKALIIKAVQLLAAPAPASPAKCECDFDAWMENPYTKVLHKSIREDYVPKADASPAALTSLELLEALKIADKFCGSLTSDTCPDSVHIPIREAVAKANAMLAASPADQGEDARDARLKAKIREEVQLILSDPCSELSHGAQRALAFIDAAMSASKEGA